LKVILVRGDADIEEALAKRKPWMLAIIKYFCDRAAVEGVGEKRKAADVSNDSQGGSAAGDGASAPAGKEALPSVGIAKEWSITEILQVVAYLVRLVREVLGITTARDLHEEMMELCGSGERQWRERCHFRRLLERLFDVPGAAALVLKYLGKCLAPTGLGEGGHAIVTAMSTEFGFANVTHRQIKAHRGELSMKKPTPKLRTHDNYQRVQRAVTRSAGAEKTRGWGNFEDSGAGGPEPPPPRDPRGWET
jgi:hypothetical protein